MAHGDTEKLRAGISRTPEYAAGDEIIFQFEGLLVGRVGRVHFDAGKARYEVALELSCEVPERLVVGALDAEGRER